MAPEIRPGAFTVALLLWPFAMMDDSTEGLYDAFTRPEHLGAYLAYWDEERRADFYALLTERLVPMMQDTDLTQPMTGEFIRAVNECYVQNESRYVH